MKHVVIGTAGHIDHGKTALVKALTGTDADRLKEEKMRGMTIDIGFAFMSDDAAFIDVPGHERFIKNMVAGVSGIDLVLFVIAADDGVMPQTKEHLDILELLGLTKGIVALTKTDLVEKDWVELIKEDIAELADGTFLEGAPIVPVSSVTGDGIDELKRILETHISSVERKKENDIFRMPVDRSFTMKGFGTIVTGTIISGRTSVGKSLELLPSEELVRIRGIQTHGKDVESASAGDRAALNLGRIDKHRIQRGDIVADAGYFSRTFMLDCKMRLLEDIFRMKGTPIVLKNRTRVRVHIGTSEIMGRVLLLDRDELAPGKSSIVQLRLESPTAAAPGDRFVIRRYSPTLTIGGGEVIDANPPKHKRFDRGVLDLLSKLQNTDTRKILEERIRMSIRSPKSLKSLASEMGKSQKSIEAEILASKNGTIVIIDDDLSCGLFHVENWETLKEQIVETLKDFHKENPLKIGLSRDGLRDAISKVDRNLFESLIRSLEDEGRVRASGMLISLPSHSICLSPHQEELREKLEETILGEGFSTSGVQAWARELGAKEDEIADVLEAMGNLGIVVRIDESIFLHKRAVQRAQEALIEYLRENTQITVSSFRGLMGTTRRYALPLLKYFDDRGITKRSGDVRTLRRL